MSEWKLVKLGDYISIKSGLSYQGSKIGKGNSYLLGMGCVSFKDKFVDSGARLYDDRGVDGSYYVLPGDIVLATRQQSDNLPILAMPAIIPKTFNGERVIFGTNLYKVDNNSEISNRFLFWLLKHQHYVSYIAGVKSGTAVQMVTKKNVENYKFYCPPKPIREKIADILWSYDDLIENNNHRIALLEKAAQELYKEWFVRFRFPGHETAKFKNGLPEGWERKKISAYYNTCSGGTPSRTNEEYYESGIYPWVKTGEVKDCIIIDTEEHITAEAVKKSSAKLLPAKSVAMAMYGVNIGQLGYFDGQMTCNQACCVFSDKRNFSSKHYLFYYLKSIREYLLLISFGAAQQNLSQELIKKIKIVMPSDYIVTAFEEEIDVIYDSIRSLMQKNQNLTKQRDLLLPRLMSGKLEV